MNTQIYEEASDWLVKNREGELGPQEKKRFDAWLRESPQHLSAYLEMSAIWENVSALDLSQSPSPDELTARVRAEANVFPLDLERSEHDARDNSHDHRGRRALYALAASILLILTATAGRLYTQRNTYATDVGEQRFIVLNDGSTVELNARSRIRVRYTETERDIELIEGQALFRVAHNATRPFIVHSDTARVRAIGTQFDVYRKKTGSIITVVEGRVAVASAVNSGLNESSDSATAAGNAQSIAALEARPSEVLLRAGEQLVLAKAGTPPALDSDRRAAGEARTPKRANIAAATAWTKRSLVFDSSPLTDVAEEFNRYNTRQLVITDPQLADFHVSGVFSSVDPQLLLRFLRTQPELNVEETDKEIRISRK
jgi:transmembrane sensor